MSMVKRAKQFSQHDGERKMKSGQKHKKKKIETEKKKKNRNRKRKLKQAEAALRCCTGKTRLHTNRRDKAGHASAQELE